METNIYLPKAPKIAKQISKNRAVFEIEDLYPGYGLTIGNALRRVMLSSLPGAAITSVKIKGVNHEFSTIPGIVEDIVEIILNLKQIRFKIYSDESQTINLKAKGEKEVKASDIKLISQVEIANPEAHIATLTSKNAVFEMEIKVEKGLGYSSIESRKTDKQEVGTIAVDAIFTPIKMINYEVEDMRVGDKTNFNRLKLDIETDGTIMPIEALTAAANILIDHYKIIISPMVKAEKEKEILAKEPKESEIEKEEIDVTKTRIEDLKLSNRTQNVLLNNHLKTVGGLVKMSEKELMGIEGLGNKALKEIKKALGKLGLTLKQQE
ncbi:DNA-directed RNA polymerase subunit alpha [Candidatus Azambacteria bacterium RIFOXYD1_FULL_42_11]|uniref:DNA-directed RNA polymerase subunit alpha n=4 Tax=Candidatus Azamiibacteriota TaxID=1752741 RepID=A0A0G1BJV3_9BACT|nr:MAG: DNA-directed RNA polymerase subunit alpha [Candidatus Azambacteria bacterium GW2011_GWB1_42_17]KKS46571.1 MAG: DNA-directed RNA polymerase subunit alpha [Candidatus Azambacteria bacterium GW2011_GWA1_42_19]KKS76065.1 MAG: DNA-directed RNA polymerase subunit alpha [Candidatus Azambacteria bacterium GW2011_GWA2_42_9]KKS88877.1 MAG: DNA-directed RNA polymerase subunit alpha [Parcubacteria group bacterium GW2011_GWC1_43_11]OGD43147.1 MAG: DNA-directed RNA polymerase subunit alpha [Candidatu